jgi:hypothetical protein
MNRSLQLGMLAGFLLLVAAWVSAGSALGVEIAVPDKATPAKISLSSAYLDTAFVLTDDFNDGDITNNPTWTTSNSAFTVVDGVLNSDGLIVDASDRYQTQYTISAVLTASDYIEMSYRGLLKSVGNPQTGRGIQMTLAGSSGSYSLSLMNGYNSGWPTDQHSISIVTDPVNNPTTLLKTSYAPAYDRMYEARAIRKGGVWYLFVDGFLIGKANDPLGLSSFTVFIINTVGSVALDDVELRNEPGPDSPVIEEFTSSTGFTSTDPDVAISGGQVNWSVSRSGGEQYVYRSIPAFNGPVRVTVKGQVSGWTNNCNVKAGIGDSLGDGAAATFGYYGGGCGITTGVVMQTGASLDYAEPSACVYTGNWLWINQNQQYIATLTLNDVDASLNVAGVGTATGTRTYTGQYDTLYVGMTGDGDWPSCSGTIDTIIYEPLATTHRISGRITQSGGAPLSGVTISDGQGHTAVTGLDGTYTITGLSPGTYTLTPSKTSVTFSPPSVEVSLPPNAIDVDFFAIVSTYSISGWVLDDAGAGVGNVLLSNSAGQSSLSGEDGYYTLSGLPSGTYALSALRDGYTCAPAAPGADTATLPPSAVEKNFKCNPVLNAESWTFMLYFAGDNEIYPQFLRAIDNLEKVANNPNVTILALVDGTNDGDTRLYKVAYNQDRNVNSAPLSVSWNPGELNMGSTTTLEAFVEWARNTYPADRYFLSIAGHGRGTSMIATDQTSGGDNLNTDQELGAAFNAFTTAGSNPLDVLLLDACTMGMLEVAAELNGYVDYIVASENIVYTVFSYDAYVNSVTEHTSPRDLALNIANTYWIKTGTWPTTISVYDMSAFAGLQAALDEFSMAVETYINDPVNITQMIDVRNAMQVFDSREYYVLDGDDEYIDLMHLAQTVQSGGLADVIAQNKAQALLSAIANFVIQNHARSGEHYYTKNHWDLDHALGLAIYFPPRSGGWDYIKYTAGDPVSGLSTWNLLNQTFWDEMLVTYFSMSGLPGETVAQDPGVPSIYDLPPVYEIFLPMLKR